MKRKEYYDIKKFISKEIKIARINHNYTLKDLAEISEMSITYISNLENNKVEKPSLYTYLILLEILEIPLTSIFKKIESMPPFNKE